MLLAARGIRRFLLLSCHSNQSRVVSHKLRILDLKKKSISYHCAKNELNLKLSIAQAIVLSDNFFFLCTNLMLKVRFSHTSNWTNFPSMNLECPA